MKCRDECGSAYFSDASEMGKLCPECAHARYGYEPCSHTFTEGRRSRCYWDGSVFGVFEEAEQFKLGPGGVRSFV